MALKIILIYYIKMLNIIFNYFEKKKVKQPKYASYPLLIKNDNKVYHVYNEFINECQWYY